MEIINNFAIKHFLTQIYIVNNDNKTSKSAISISILNLFMLIIENCHQPSKQA